MRKETVLQDFYFTKAKYETVPTAIDDKWEKVTLPHTWNAVDGVSGGNDYYRGTCYYLNDIHFSGITPDHDYILRFDGVSYQATVYCNGMKIASHTGGYSAFTADITKFLKHGENTLVVQVSNEAGDYYPAMADFTFYGGIHRKVTLLELSETRFDMGAYADSGFLVTSEKQKDGAVLHLQSDIKNPSPAYRVCYHVKDRDNREIATAVGSAMQPDCDIFLPHPHLWQGTDDPYLYTVTAELQRHNEVVDSVTVKHGIRSYRVDSEKGFFLNGVSHPLHGVSRHEDRLYFGNALTEKMEEEDMAILLESGANAVRLAHYQQSEHFLDLCDEAGLVVWAEIPFITSMQEGDAARENALLQMRELVLQQRNHTGICFWGIANEITIGGNSEKLKENLEELHALVKSIDSTRLTVMAEVSMLPPEDTINDIPDVLAYNHYFGWYGGNLADNERWFDTFHDQYPYRPIALSEYGAEGILTYHSDAPKAGDYTEEYQAIYHEHMLQILTKRPYIFAFFVWNLFDFGSDIRDEGGTVGRNHKGLVSFDRKIKKDSFYLYKTYFGKEPVLHICGTRYHTRKSGKAELKIYSTFPEVALFLNGIQIAKQTGDKIFIFKNMEFANGHYTLTANAGPLETSAVFTFADEVPSYFLYKEPESEGVQNWFADKSVPDAMTFDSDCYSVKDKIKDIMQNTLAGDVLYRAVASVSDFKVKKPMLMILGDRTPEAIWKEQKAESANPHLLAVLNAELQKIAKET